MPVVETRAVMASPVRRADRVVSVALYNRAGYSRRVLDALAKCDGIGGYHVIFCVDKGDPAVLRLAEEHPGFRSRRVLAHGRRVGCDANIRHCLVLGFNVCDYVVVVEDDVVPAADFLRLFEYCRGAYQDDPDIHTVGAYNRGRPRPEDHHRLARSRLFVPWGWATWLDRWKEPGGMWQNWGLDKGWDTHLDHALRRGRAQVRPILGRAQNIGAVGGWHVNDPSWHAKHQFSPVWAGSVGKVPKGRFYE